jgi:hypothetical protein
LRASISARRSSVELASGLGLIRDAVTIANDASASLTQKVALFGASAMITPQDRERLEVLLAAVDAQRSLREAEPVPTEAVTDTLAEVATGNGPFVLRSNHHTATNGSP